MAQLFEATSRKATGSICDGVIGIVYLHNPSGRTVALGSTQPLAEVSRVGGGLRAGLDGQKISSPPEFDRGPSSQ